MRNVLSPTDTGLLIKKTIVSSDTNKWQIAVNTEKFPFSSRLSTSLFPCPIVGHIPVPAFSIASKMLSIHTFPFIGIEWISVCVVLPRETVKSEIGRPLVLEKRFCAPIHPNRILFMRFLIVFLCSVSAVLTFRNIANSGTRNFIENLCFD